MLFVNDTRFEREYFDRAFETFSAHPLLRDCSDLRIAVRITDAAFSLALCLYMKEYGGCIFPLAVDTPRAAAERRARQSGCSHLVFGTDGVEALGQLQTLDGGKPVARSHASGGLVQMSSGTTGEPKYLERSWESINAEVEAYVEIFPEGAGMTPVVACPTNHSYGLICGVLVALKRGLVPIVVQNLNPKYVLRRLSEAESPLLYSSPTLLTTLAMLAREDAPIHAIMTSGSVMQKSCFEQLRRKVSHIYQQYGCSEAGCISLAKNIRVANEIGRVLPHLQATAGAKRGAPQEIFVTLPGGRVVATRDLGYFYNDNLHFVARIDDMINVSGLNVFPGEVEDVILEMPEITEAVVFRRKHSFGNDQVCLQFVASSPLSGSIIRQWCANKLARYQIPMLIEQVQAIPKLPNGKVSRRALGQAKPYLATLAP